MTSPNPPTMKMLTSPKVLEFLRSHSVRDLIDQRLPRKLSSSIEAYKDIKTDVNQLGRELISVDHQCTVTDVIRLMKDKGVTKVPVFRRLSDGEKDFFAIVTVLDLLHYVAFQDAWSRLPTDIREVETENVEEFKKIVQENAAIFDQPVEAVIGFNAESKKIVRLYIDDNAEELCRALTSTHEVLITDRGHETEDIYNTLITQTDAVWYLVNNKNSMNDGTFDVPVGKVMVTTRRGQDFDPNQVVGPGLAPRTHFVVKADHSLSALVCFRMMRTHRVTSVALVDEQGKLNGNLSASDLRNVGRENFIDICLPVIQFLERYNPDSISRIVTVRSDDTLSKAIETAIYGKIHRVYVVDEKNKPTAIITMSDMMSAIMNVVPGEE